MHRIATTTRLAALAATLALAALPASAQDMGGSVPAPEVSPSAEAVQAHLERTRALFLAAIDGLTPEQWAWKPAPDRWSVGECAEHITRTEAALREVARGTITQPATPELLAKSHGKSASVLAVVVDRTQRFQAPEPFNPVKQGDLRSHAQIVRDYNFERGRSVEIAASHPNLEAYASMSPFVQELDLAGWLYFLSGHTERHTKQIEEVKATPGFPQG